MNLNHSDKYSDQSADTQNEASFSLEYLQNKLGGKVRAALLPVLLAMSGAGVTYAAMPAGINAPAKNEKSEKGDVSYNGVKPYQSAKSYKGEKPYKGDKAYRGGKAFFPPNGMYSGEKCIDLDIARQVSQSKRIER